MTTRHLSAVQQGQSQQHDVHAEACDTSLKETMNTTVEKDATANDISDESKDKVVEWGWL